MIRPVVLNVHEYKDNSPLHILLSPSLLCTHATSLYTYMDSRLTIHFYSNSPTQMHRNGNCCQLSCMLLATSSTAFVSTPLQVLQVQAKKSHLNSCWWFLRHVLLHLLRRNRHLWKRRLTAHGAVVRVNRSTQCRSLLPSSSFSFP